ncbi:nuclear transport factor 2 family protein [Nostocaceae cyanobacterium CENA357]|uniref:Nuclear transport factor 2 family protein n=1 Tax=Atlanticothrix silvestris CENA357 TaxID=1725252 RepID=A0A8J7L5V1_9CYAN|nr:nuclear transport factor 2 family protein [Atlanticothrix silvestris]MBH8556404.1 nuclear transport factor 2 family protein [Atlanticothrix silvestris CENA357]
MNQQEIRTLIEKARYAWASQDADALAQIFTADGEIIVPGQKWRGQAKIREEITNFAQQYSNVKIEIRRVLIENNQAAVEWYYEDTEKATGRRNKADDVIVIDFQDGCISRWREYFDTKTPASNQQ